MSLKITFPYDASDFTITGRLLMVFGRMDLLSVIY